MSAPDSETVFLGAYWRDRPETAERCAGRLLRTIEALEPIDPLFSGWVAARTEAPLPRDPAAVTELLLGDRDHRTDGSVVPDAGCSLVVQSRPDGAGASLLVRCGSYAGIPSLFNAVVLEPIRPDRPDDVWLREATRIAAAVVEAWEPEWAALGPPSFRAAQPERDGAPYVGAVTYLSDALGPLPPLPDDVSLSRLAGGHLLSLVDGGRLPEIERVLRLARALEATGYGASGDRERAAPLLDVLNVDQREESLRYQEQVTGVVRGRAYQVRDVDFASYEGGTLIGVVGPGHSRLFGDEVARACIEARLLDRADKQVWAAAAQPIEWRVAELDVAREIERLLADAGHGSAIRVRQIPAAAR
jgi:hypothetical protein